MAFSSSSVGLMAAVMAMLWLVAAANVNPQNLPGIMSIHNDFPSKLYVQCDSDKEHQPVDMVWPQEAHRFNFDPEAQNYWMCTIRTTPNEPKNGFVPVPVPAVWGKFTVFSKIPTFRACYPICVWKANNDGLSLIIKAGDDPTLIYRWSKQ